MITKGFYKESSVYSTRSIYKEGDENSVFIAGRSYKTVKIGNRIWMAEPLMFEIEGVVYNPDRTFGAYYDNSSDIDKILEVAPSGWRIPKFGVDDADFQGIYTAGANALQSTEYPSIFPDATNSSGFDARPSGGYSKSSGTFPAVNMTKNLILTHNLTTCVIIEPTKITSYNFGSNASSYRFPIRLVKEA